MTNRENTTVGLVAALLPATALVGIAIGYMMGKNEHSESDDRDTGVRRGLDEPRSCPTG